MHDPTDIVARLDREARVERTPCGAGSMVWHRWPATGAGAARTVVLLHGGSGSWTHWIKTIPALRRRYHVLAADLPGLGDSAMPPEPLTPATSAAIIAEAIRELLSGEPSPHMVGFSFGAHVGTIAATLLGDRLASFTICGSAALGLTVKPLKYPKERTGMTEAEQAAVHRGTLEILMFHDKSRIDDLAIRIQADNVRRSRFRSRPFALTDEIRRRLADVKVPVNAIWGARDVIARPSVEACFEVIGEHHPELLSRSIADAGHWVMYEQPAGYNSALLEVLAARE